MKLAILHLSDIHIKDETCTVLSRTDAIAQTLNSVDRDIRLMYLIVTGDIAFSGEEAQYELAKNFFDNIISAARARSPSASVHTILVAGNHDGKFKGSGNARKSVIENVLNGDIEIDQSVIDTCCAPQKEFFSALEHYPDDNLSFRDLLWSQYDYGIDGFKISISAINASWMSQVPETPGKLAFPVQQYTDYATQSADLKLALLHHPLNWYAQGTYHPLREMCRSHFQIVMSGHEHAASTTLIDDSTRGTHLTFEAAALEPHAKDEVSGYSIVQFDLAEGRYGKIDYAWNGKQYMPSRGEGLRFDMLPLPPKRTDEFTLTLQQKARLEDVGATFTHPNKEKIVLSDIFVFPDLKDLAAAVEPEGIESINSDRLVKELDKHPKTLIRGDDQFGKTALLSTLFQSYFASGFIPVLLTGRDLIGENEDKISRNISAAIQAQYGEVAPQRFAQLERNRKVLLLDDLDKHTYHPDSLAKALEYIEKNFDYAVVTVSERFDVAEYASARTIEATAGFEQFKILGFGYRLRSRLIRRWLNIGDVFDSAEVMQTKIHDAESIIDSVIGKGLVPTTAFNVLVLLQSLETGTKGVLANAGMAEYYEFLIRRSLFHAKLKAEEFDEVFSYLSRLAWEFYSRRAKYLDETDLATFNERFSEEVHRTELSTRIDLLQKCRVLVRVGASFAFRYEYIRYFFAAKYIADNLEDDATLKPLVLHACQHLYLRENANIVLFLTHHSSSKWIIKEVASVLSRLVSDARPFDLQTDTSVLNTWVTQQAKVIVDARNITENRDAQRQREDDYAELPDNEPSGEVSSLDELDQIAQLNLLFKTSEILGQILKNRYGSLDKSFKKELVYELFAGPLRGINKFLSLLNSAPEAILDNVSSLLQEKLPKLTKQDADKHAQRLIFSSLGMVAESFISRQGEVIGSPKLKETIDTVSKESGQDTFSLVSVAAQLSYPGHVPIGGIESLAKKLETNVFGYRLLQGLVGRHMYMFSVPHEERHRLTTSVGIKLRTQIARETQTDVKRLPAPGRPSHQKGLLGRLHKSFLLRNEASVKATLEKSNAKEKSD